MANKITINPSIASIVDIDSVGKNEVVPIYFTANENWVGTYNIELWNSDKKNTDFQLPEDFVVDVGGEETTIETLKVENMQMTLTIAPTEQNIDAGNYYFEITKLEDKRIIFKGSLIIIK